MTPDERLRLEERALAKREGDAAGWSRLSREYERLGRRDDAARSALRAHRAAASDPDVLARLDALDVIEGPWPCQRGDAQNRQASPLEGPDEGVQRWRLDLPRPCEGRPLIDLRGRTIVRANYRNLLRVDPPGLQLEDLGPLFFGAEPTIVAGEPAGYFTDGWRVLGPRSPDSEVHESPWIDTISRGAGGRLFAWGKSLAEFGAKGEIRWRVSAHGDVHDLTILSEHLLLAVVERGGQQYLRAIDADSGERRWEGAASSSAPNDRTSLATADDGSCLVARRDSIRCVGPRGEERWKRKLGDKVRAPATAGDRVVVTTGYEVIDLALSTGEVRWRRELRAGEPPTLDGRGVAYVSTHDGRVLGLRPDGTTHCQAIVHGTGAPSAVSIGWDRTAFVTVGPELVALR